MNIFEFVIYIVFSLVIVTLLYVVVAISFKNRQLYTSLVQAELDRLSTLSELVNIKEESEQASVEKTDGFLRFLSESRDMAFIYIEDVQQALVEYAKVSTDLSLDGMSEEEKLEYKKAYDKIMSFLPNEEEKIND